MKLLDDLQLKKSNLYMEQAIQNGEIVPFDDEFYKWLEDTFIGCLPVSIIIKHMLPGPNYGDCFFRSLYLFLCFKDSVLVRGDTIVHRIKYGQEKSEHGWIEIGDYVYDTTLLSRISKNAYYRIYKPYNLKKYTHEEYGSNDLYDDVMSTTIDDFKPNGKKRIGLHMIAMSALPYAELLPDKSLLNDLNKFFERADYSLDKGFEELNNMSIPVDGMKF